MASDLHPERRMDSFFRSKNITPADIIAAIEGTPLGKCIDYHIGLYASAWNVERAQIQSIAMRPMTHMATEGDTPTKDTPLHISLEFTGHLVMNFVYNPLEWRLVNF